MRTRGGGGQKNPKTLRTSYVHVPLLTKHGYFAIVPQLIGAPILHVAGAPYFHHVDIDATDEEDGQVAPHEGQVVHSLVSRLPQPLLGVSHFNEVIHISIKMTITRPSFPPTLELMD